MGLVFEMVDEEKDVTQVKVRNELLKKIREANSDYQFVPAKDIAHIALNHFLYELKHRRSDLPDQFSMEKKREV